MNCRLLVCSAALAACVCVARAQSPDACADLANVKIPGVEITKAAPVPAGKMPAPRGMPGYAGELPAHCRVDGMIDRRTGVDGKPYGIGFALALPLPEKWNRDFLMQGGGGGNGFIAPPIGGGVAGEAPALLRGFAVASTDTGHRSAQVFDFGFMRDQQAMLDFAFLANQRVAALSKELIARYYGKPASYSYFVGCSTGGREGMILSQRYPTVFNGIVSGAPARRTGHSNLAAFLNAQVAYNNAAPKDESGKPVITKALSDGDRKLVIDALLQQCDAKDGVADGMIFDPVGCDFDPAVLTCKGGKDDSCLSEAQVKAIQRVFAGPKDSRGFPVYAPFLYDTGIAAKAPTPGLLTPGPGLFGPPTTATEMNFDEPARTGLSPLVDALSTNLATFAGNGGKLIFYHGVSDPWFSALDTLGYYKDMANDNGGLDKVRSWSQIFLVPGMGHCGGGAATLDQFDMLTAVVDWVEKGKAPDSVIATGKAFPGRSRPLCAWPKHAHYKGQGSTEDAANFECR